MKKYLWFFCVAFLFSNSPALAAPPLPNNVPPSCDTHQVSACPLVRCTAQKDCFGKDVCVDKTSRSDDDIKCGSTGYYAQDVECCTGLIRRCGQIKPDGECSPSNYYGPTCLPCGDGVCDSLENKCNCPEDCQPTTARPKIKYVVQQYPSSPPALAPNIGITYNKETMQEDVPAKLKEAYDSRDGSICDKLLDIKSIQYSGGDSVYFTPYRKEYVDYCKILAARDASKCKGLRTSSASSSLFYSYCESFFQGMVANQNTSPQFCFEQLGKTFFSVDIVRNCYLAWEHKIFGRSNLDEIRVSETIEPFTALDMDILRCIEVHSMEINARGASNTKKETADQCFYELAVKSKNAKICGFIFNPYDNNPWSHNKCIEKVAQNKVIH